MPELPEVETIKRQLSKKLIGKRVKNIDIRLPKLIKNASIAYFEKNINNTTIKSINRRAKIIIINLSNNFSLLIHLKLTGQLILHQIYNAKQITKHTHLIYHFSDGSALLHNDMRQFGYIKLAPTEKIKKILEIEEKFGPEPLNKNFTLEQFKKILAKRGGAKIKQLLMNQTFIAGIGNIYSDEILFYAKIRPLRIISDLKPEEIKKIYQGIKKILPEAIRFHGTSKDTYVDISGHEGKYSQKLKVYDREGQFCFKCGDKIERLKIGGRSAHFCPRCQK